MSDEDLRKSLEAVQSLLQPLKQGEFSKSLYKVSVYIEAIEKSWNTCSSSLKALEQKKRDDPESYRKAVEAKVKGFEASLKSSIKFARMNLDQAMAQALDKLIPRPRGMTKTDEVKRAGPLQKWFDELPDPTSAMLEHYKESSIPLDKYLVAGNWGHEYLRKRRINSEEYDRELCETLLCSDSAAGKIVLNYGKLSRAIDALEERALEALEGKSSLDSMGK